MYIYIYLFIYMYIYIHMHTPYLAALPIRYVGHSMDRPFERGSFSPLAGGLSHHGGPQSKAGRLWESVCQQLSGLLFHLRQYPLPSRDFPLRPWFWGYRARKGRYWEYSGSCGSKHIQLAPAMGPSGLLERDPKYGGGGGGGGGSIGGDICRPALVPASFATNRHS